MHRQTGEGEAVRTILKLLRQTTSWFASRNIENPRASAEILLARVLGVQRIDLYLRYDQPLMPDELAGFRELVRRRAAHEPVAYITGQRGFWSLDLKVNPSVLIPRPETECLVEAALEVIRKEPGEKDRKILEPGTGSGAIILALAAEHPEFRFYASDISCAALETAKSNAVRNGAEGKICFFAGNWFAPFRENHPGFDMIISNPPYIPSGQIAGLQAEVSRYEPVRALDGGPDGLSAIRKILSHACAYLKKGGYLLMEIGYDQGEQVMRLAGEQGEYEHISCTKDYSGNDRVVRMRKKKNE